MNIKEQLITGSKNAIVHGRAGSGKSTLIKTIADEYKGNVLLLAPTGIAAENIGGRTIDSFIYPAKYGYKKIARKLSLYDLIIIDEISMVHLYKLTKLETLTRHAEVIFNKKLRYIFFGDIHQLPPVITDNDIAALRLLPERHNITRDDLFFFQSTYLKTSIALKNMDLYYLNSSYRQQPDEILFITLLDKIALCQITQADLDILNSRVIPSALQDNSDITYLTTTRKAAEEINRKKLNQIKHISFAPVIKRYDATQASWFVSEAEKNDCLNHIVDIGVGIPVVFTRNDSSGRWKNGNQGVITGILKNDNTNDLTVIVLKKNGETVAVNKVKAPITISIASKKNDELIQKEIGEIQQYPFMTGYAFTIHKAQGMTLDSIAVDTGAGCFASGQLYVALSRVRRLEDLYLKKPIKMSDLNPNEAIEKYWQEFTSKAIMV